MAAARVVMALPIDGGGCTDRGRTEGRSSVQKRGFTTLAELVPMALPPALRRYLTDIAFGNRHGMLTVHVQPLTSQGEPFGVLLVGRFGVALGSSPGLHCRNRNGLSDRGAAVACVPSTDVAAEPWLIADSRGLRAVGSPLRRASAGLRSALPLLPLLEVGSPSLPLVTCDLRQWAPDHRHESPPSPHHIKPGSPQHTSLTLGRSVASSCTAELDACRRA
jgi:hypothetical protein